MSGNIEEWQEVVLGGEAMWDKKTTISGRLVSAKDAIGPNNSKLYTLATETGEVGLWGSTVLDNKFERIELGSMVKIEPLGEAKSEKTGRNYQDFRVFFKPKAEEPIDMKEIPF